MIIFFQEKYRHRLAGSMAAVFLLFTGNVVSAEDWYSLNEEPYGKVAHPPVIVFRLEAAAGKFG